MLQTLAAIVHDLSIVDNSTAYCATDTGIHKTINGGQTWQIMSDSTAITTINCVDDLVVATDLGGVRISSDQGETWSRYGLPVPNTVASDMVLHDDFWLVSTLDDGVLQSTNHGQTWRGWNFGLLDWRVMALAVTDDGLVYAGTETGLYVSENGGKGWQDTHDATIDPILSLVATGLDVILGTESGKVLNFSDGDVMTLYTSNTPINCIAQFDGGQLAIATGQHLMITTDNANTWTTLTEQLCDISAIQWVDQQNLLLGTVLGDIQPHKLKD